MKNVPPLVYARIVATRPYHLATTAPERLTTLPGRFMPVSDALRSPYEPASNLC